MILLQTDPDLVQRSLTRNQVNMIAVIFIDDNIHVCKLQVVASPIGMNLTCRVNDLPRRGAMNTILHLLSAKPTSGKRLPRLPTAQ